MAKVPPPPPSVKSGHDFHEKSKEAVEDHQISKIVWSFQDNLFIILYNTKRMTEYRSAEILTTSWNELTL